MERDRSVVPPSFPTAGVCVNVTLSSPRPGTLSISNHLHRGSASRLGYGLKNEYAQSRDQVGNNDPVQFHVSSVCECNIILSIELQLKGLNSELPVLGVFIFTIRTVPKVRGAADNFTTSMMKSGMWHSGLSGRRRCGVTMYP